MWFEISTRIQSSVSHEELTTALESQLRKVARKVQSVGAALEVTSVHTTFGSINGAHKTSIDDCLERVGNEFDRAVPVASRSVASPISDIQRLGSLKDKGLITEAEFNAKKKHLLQL